MGKLIDLFTVSIWVTIYFLLGLITEQVVLIAAEKHGLTLRGNSSFHIFIWWVTWIYYLYMVVADIVNAMRGK